MAGKTAIVVPWQDRGDPDRRAAKEYVVRYLESLDIGPVFVGTYPVDDKPFNLSRCRNEGAKAALADGADVLVFNDADTLSPPHTLQLAAQLAAEADGVVLLGDAEYRPLTREESLSLLSSQEAPQFGDYSRNPHRVSGAIPEEWLSGGGCAVSASTYLRVGGYDEHLEGWSPEDCDFYWASDKWIAPTRVAPGAIWTLWHPHPFFAEDGSRTGPVNVEGTEERRLWLDGWTLLTKKKSSCQSLEEWRRMTQGGSLNAADAEFYTSTFYDLYTKATSPQIALGLIVKNEAHVIQRCIESAAPFISEVHLLDTGSTDGTHKAAIAASHEFGIPLYWYEAEWTNFGEMRSLMMARARTQSSCEWMLQVDADWVLETDDRLDLSVLDASQFDAWPLTITEGGTSWPLHKFTSLKHPWRYDGPVHEVLTSDDGGTLAPAPVPGIWAVHRADGGSREGRHYKDAEILKDRDDPRSQFYYAQSLFSTMQWEASRDAYQVRADNPDGWEEEVYWSLYRKAMCSRMLGDTDRALSEALIAWNRRTYRLEALHLAQEICREKRAWSLGKMLGDRAVAIAEDGFALSNDRLFLEPWRWEWGVKWEAIIANGVIGDANQAVVDLEQMLLLDYLPESYVAATRHNIEWFANQT